MEADFSGYATKAGLKCSDGKVIMPQAFQHQDKIQVPLVWQHGHTDPENVLGHAILEARPDGIYTYGFFNKSKKAAHAKELLDHKDITQLSIWANDLVMRAEKVLHGAIREVSLVLSGANPGAKIENVTIRHSDGDEDTLDDEVIIWSGVPIEHSDKVEVPVADKEVNVKDNVNQLVYDSMTDEQKQLFHFMVDEALSSADTADDDASLVHAMGDDATVQDIYDSMTDQQKQVVHFLVGEALASSSGSLKQDNVDTDTKGSTMKHNVFEGDDKKGPAPVVLSHSEIQNIVADATKEGSLKEAVEKYALAHGIQDIDLMFPDAKAISDTPELYARRSEWVSNLLAGVRKSPFSRIKSLSADLTVQEARAKGYIKGNLKKEEFFRVARRITTPQTIYKKQKLDRDDIVDITDFDVVVWLKGEMRLMLDEELARAILVGDGRAVDDEDKINEDNIRPIATDHEIYTTKVYVNIDDSNSSVQEIIDGIVMNRSSLRGTGLPTMYISETYIARFMLLRDTTGRRIYRSLAELVDELRVSSVVSVEVLEEHPDIVCILVNPTDYVVGADRGGAVSLFDDFDIDYNQYKYLIETRASGALIKLKSALVVLKVEGTAVLVSPAAPIFDGDEITIVNQTGVVYRNAATDAIMNAESSPYAVDDDETVTVVATSASGYYFASSDNDTWSFTGTA